MAGWDFVRDSVAYKTFTAGGAHAVNSKMGLVGANVPRITTDGLLIEGQAENRCKQSETFDITWGTNQASVVSDTATQLAPNGTQTVDIIHEDDTEAGDHYVFQGGTHFSVIFHQEYTVSVYVKAINRSWICLRASQTPDPGAYFNIETGLIGTIDEDITHANIEPLDDGWYRCSITWSATGTFNSGLKIYVAENDNDITFTGLDQDSFYIWGAQFERGSFPTSYIPTTIVPYTRAGDDMSMFPLTLSEDPAGDNNDKWMWIDFDQPGHPATTLLTSDGGHTFGKPTARGGAAPDDQYSEELGYYHDGFGSLTYWIQQQHYDPFSLGTVWSMQGVIIPDAIDAGVYRPIMSKISKDRKGDTGWMVFQDDDSLSLQCIGTVGGTTTITKSSCLEAGVPAFFTITYDNREVNIYVNDLSVEYEANAAVIDTNVTAAAIGAGDNDEFSGGIAYLALWSIVLTEEQHDEDYAAWVSDPAADDPLFIPELFFGALPISLGGSSPHDKLTISFDLKGLWSDDTDIGSRKELISISGTEGSAENGNYFSITVGYNAELDFYFYDNIQREFWGYTNGSPIDDWSEWHSFRIVLDFADMSRMGIWIDDNDDIGMSYNETNTGTAELNMTDTRIRIGQDSNGTVCAGFRIRNLKIAAEEIRP